MQAGYLRREGGDVRVWLVAAELAPRALHPLERAVELAALPRDAAQASSDPRSVVGLMVLVKERERALERRLRLLGIAGAKRHLAGVLHQPRALDPLLGERGRLDKVALCLLARGERGCALARPGEQFPGALLDLPCVCVLGRGLVGGQVVGGQYLDHFLL
jgi:hypothetical protein